MSQVYFVTHVPGCSDHHALKATLWEMSTK
jgi:hypothetical protein